MPKDQNVFKSNQITSNQNDQNLFVHMKKRLLT